MPSFVGAPGGISFPLKGGTLWIDAAAWKQHSAAIISRSGGLLRDDNGKPIPTLPPDAFAAKDSELIACEVECRRSGIEGEGGVFVVLDIPGLDAAAA